MMGPCLEWQGVRDKDGYGRIKGGKLKAHRVAYEEAFGPIPVGQLVLHKCDNPPCCRPSHLFLGSHADNVHDMERKGRDRHPAGEDNGMAKLTMENVIDIRTRLRSGETGRVLAADFGVSEGLISKIRHGKRWMKGVG